MPSPHRRVRVATAVLLVRGGGNGGRRNGGGAEPEVLLVERAPELRFFGGYLALPGGVLEAGDGTTTPPTGTESENSATETAAGSDERRTALRRCALRELFEETGVLLDPSPPQAGASGAAREPAHDTVRERARRALIAGDPAPWSALRTASGARAAEPHGQLQQLCRILTPPFAPVRYDTVFYLAELPAGEIPEIWPGELRGGRFWRPEEALLAWRRGEVRIVPPVVILLELLAQADGLGSFARSVADLAADYDRGRLHRVRFSPGVIMASLATPTLPPATTTNCLIVGESELFVVDPATPEPDEQRRLFALLDELVAEGRRLGGILLTHHHRDHVGAAAATSRRYDLPIRAHELTLSRLAPGFLPGPPLADGDSIPLGTAPDGSPDWRLEALHTPGHDRGHLCFSESRYHALLAGDMLSTVSTIVIDPPEGNLATYLKSLERLLAVPVDTLYPAHGPAVPNGHRLVRRYLQHRAEREAALVAALGPRPASARELVTAVYADVPTELHALAERSLTAGLEKLAEEGRVRLEEDGVWRLLAPC